MAQYALTCAILALSYVLVRRLAFRRRARGYPLPPSRPGYPFLGHVFEIPSQNEHVIYRQWGKELNSDLLWLNAAGTPIVVLNSVELATEMLEKRSSIYSSRPGAIMLNELMGWEWVMSNLSYGEKWKERRKQFQRYFSPSNKAAHVPHAQEHIPRLLVKLLNSPEQFLSHLRHFVGGLALAITYSIPIKPTNDPYVALAEEAISTGAEAGVPGTYYVDFIPALRYVPEWFPGAGFQRKAKQWRMLMETMRYKPFNDSESYITAGKAQPSFISASLDAIDPTKNVAHQRQVIQETAAMVFIAASDTTTSALSTFFLAMLCYPKVQTRAQEEVDRVLDGRLPDARDESKLPYIMAIVKEVLRWHPATPINIPHKSDQDDIFRDYFIPKGTIVIPNAWAMLHNEQDYPQPDEFIPERFLDEEGRLNTAVRDPSTIAFGFGRRSCPGAHIAQSNLWLTIASILALFDISKLVGANGEPVEPRIDYRPGIISHPEPFECSIKPRSKKANEMIRSFHISELSM